MWWIRCLSAGCLFSCLVASAQVIQVPVSPFPGSGSYGPPVGLFTAQLRIGGSYLGVHLIEVDEERARELKMPAPSGVEITSVAEDSPAEKGGILRGDVILEFRGEKVAGVEHFMRLVRETPVGRDVTVVVWRNGAEKTLTVEVGERRAPNVTFLRKNCEEEGNCEGPPFDLTMPNFDVHVPMPHVVLRSRVLGAELEAVKGQFSEFFGVDEGVLVRSVDSNSPAGRALLKAGDVIVSVNGEAVKTPRQVHSAIATADSDTVSIEVMRAHRGMTLQIESAGTGGSPARRYGGGRAIQTRRL